VTPESADKVAAVRGLLGNGVDTVVLRTPASVAWLSGGGRTHIEATPPEGVAAVVVRADEVVVVTAVNEADRLRAEELGGLDARWQVLGWEDDLAAALPAGPTVGADLPVAGVRDLAGPLADLRAGLSEAEVARYREVGRAAAEAMTDACATLGPRDPEWQAAAALGGALLERGMDPVVLLVAGGQRLPAHRHPLPTAGPLGPLVMLVACARRGGLIANLTRFVSFGPLSAQHRERYGRLLAVESAYLAATTPGATVGEVFSTGASAYAANGFDADEWRLHHQGGPTGYATREYLADGDSPAIVAERQAFAWNPSVPELKVEDTVLATAGGVRVLTVDPRWPSVRVDGRDRPLVLER